MMKSVMVKEFPWLRKYFGEDIDWAIGLEYDLLQFMGLGPTPGTRLYQDYEAARKIVAGSNMFSINLTAFQFR